MPRRRKTPAKSPKAVALRGNLQTGNPGNVGGTGRPPSALREHLRGTFGERIAIIESIADGRPMQRSQIRLLDVLPYVVCANCGESELKAKEDETAGLVEIDAMVSASPKDRLAALDLAAKYGLGTLREISIENVRERVQGTLEVIRQHCPPELVRQMLPALRAQWA